MPTLTGLHRSANPSMQLVSTTQIQYLSGHVQLPPGRKQRGVHPNRLGKRREKGADKSLWMQGMQAAGNALCPRLVPGLPRENRGKLPAQQDTALPPAHSLHPGFTRETFSLFSSLPQPHREELDVTRLLTHSPSLSLLGVWGCFLSNK